MPESAATHQAPDSRHQLVRSLAALILTGTHDAMVGVIVQQPERDLVERRLHGRDLSQDIDAVALVLDHPLDPANLPPDPAQPLDELILGGAVTTFHVLKDTPVGYHK